MVRTPLVLVAASILAQISWILVPAGERQLVTTLVVLLFTAATWSHAYVSFGAVWTAAYAGITVTFGLLVELLGSRTGFPFSPYEYTSALQPQIGGVPMIVPLAWSMMAYPALMLARSLTIRWAAPLAAVGLSAWDLFLDPQMVGEGYWVWENQHPALPGVPGIPVWNYLGWLLATMVLMLALDRLPHKSIDLGVPLLLYGWMWIGGVIANAIFLGRPGVAIAGGAGMAILAVPAMRKWWRA